MTRDIRNTARDLKPNQDSNPTLDSTQLIVFGDVDGDSKTVTMLTRYTYHLRDSSSSAATDMNQRTHRTARLELWTRPMRMGS